MYSVDLARPRGSDVFLQKGPNIVNLFNNSVQNGLEESFITYAR